MGPSGRFYSCMSYDVVWDRLCTLGRAPPVHIINNYNNILALIINIIII